MRHIATGTLGSAIEFAVIFVGAVATAPLLLSHLGLAGYGAYVGLMLLSANRGLAVMDLGMQGALMANLPRWNGPDHADVRRRALVFGMGYFAVVGLVVSTTLWLIAGAIAHWLGDGGLELDLVPAVHIMSGTIFIQFLAMPLLAHGLAVRSFARTKVIEIVTAILHYVGVGTLAIYHAPLATILVVPLGVAGLRFIAQGIAAWHHERQHAQPVAQQTAPVRRPLLGDAVKMFGNRVIGLTYNYMDAAIITSSHGAAGLATYDLSAKPAQAVNALASTGASTVTPEVGRLQNLRGSFDFIHRMTRYVHVPVVLATALLFGAMPLILNAWLGNPPADVSMLAQVFVLAVFPIALNSIAGNMIAGLRLVGRALWIPASTTALNLVLSLTLVGPLGILGVLIGTLVGNWIGLLAHVAFLARVGPLENPWNRRTFLAATTAIAAVAAYLAVPTEVTWATVAATAAIAASHGIALLWVLTTPAERAHLQAVLRRTPADD